MGVTGMQGMQPHNLRFYERKQIYLTPKGFFFYCISNNSNVFKNLSGSIENVKKDEYFYNH